VDYAKALVEYDKKVGRTLQKNNIEIDKQLIAGASGSLSGSGTARPSADNPMRA